MADRARLIATLVQTRRSTIAASTRWSMSATNRMRAMTPDRLRSVLLGVFAALALLLAAIGIYGVVAYAAAQRKHEIGVRAALGASPAALVRLVVRHAVALAAVGLVIGGVAATWATRWLSAFLFGVGPSDVVTWLVAGAMLMGIGVLASYIPGRAAASADPLEALRVE